ncbi:MAG: ATP-binding protein [Dehalococcoidia bacterium]
MAQVDVALEETGAQATAHLEPVGGRLRFDPQDIEVIGEIEALSATTLTLQGGPTLRIENDTEFVENNDSSTVHPIEVGTRVKVEAKPEGETLVAIKVEPETEHSTPNGLAPVIPDLINRGSYVFRVVGPDGAPWDTLGNVESGVFSFSAKSGFGENKDQNSQSWRLHTRALLSANGDTIGWLQTARSLESVQTTLSSVRTQFYWSIPFSVLVVTLGGLLVAHLGLRPIERITRTAEEITGSALNQRIHHQGPEDELGRLSRTLDAMLDRLEETILKERRFAADASHELRTPLTALKGRIDVTLSSPRNQAAYESTLKSLEGEVDRLIRLTNELLFLARADHGQLTWHPEEVNLHDMVEAVVDQIPDTEDKGITISREVPKSLMIESDPDHLIRLLLNLVNNACQHTPFGGNVHVAAERTSDVLRISVSDNGVGIPEEHQAHLFERFYRVDQARSIDTGGTGLGLSIAYEITQLGKGNLEFTSEVGVGTTFTAVLPATTSTISPGISRAKANVPW